MLGLIKKDFLLMKSNIKSMIIIFIVYLILAFQNTFDATSVVPIMGIMLFISTFSYDDFNNWNSYAITLPDGRKNVVKAKYIASIILIVILGILSLCISIGINYARTNTVSLSQIIPSLMGSLLSSSIVVSLLYPVVFKFGATNARIILFAVVFGIMGVITIISKSVDITFIINMINSLDNYSFIIIPMMFVTLLSISYLISTNIYKNKEF